MGNCNSIWFNPATNLWQISSELSPHAVPQMCRSQSRQVKRVLKARATEGINLCLAGRLGQKHSRNYRCTACGNGLKDSKTMKQRYKCCHFLLLKYLIKYRIWMIIENKGLTISEFESIFIDRILEIDRCDKVLSWNTLS